jgi:hypothetical protein
MNVKIFDAMETGDILKRVDKLLSLATEMGPDVHTNAAELSQGCVSLLSLVYGQKSAQVQQFNSAITTIAKDSGGYKNYWIATAAHGTLKNLKQEIEAGITGRLRHQVTGEVLADLVQLARVVLEQPGDGAKNVAAVLAAAAFEDTLRRMGETFAGIVGKEDLPDVLKALRDADVIQGTQVGIAQGYFSFRNRALHANWNEIQRESVLSALGFVEGLLTKHFS